MLTETAGVLAEAHQLGLEGAGGRLVPFYAVSDLVLREVRDIDEWLDGCARSLPQLPQGVLRWGALVEGGDTSQRVQDRRIIRAWLDAAHAETGARLLVADADLGGFAVAVAREWARDHGLEIRVTGRATWPFVRSELRRLAYPIAALVYCSGRVLSVARSGRPMADGLRPLDVVMALNSSRRKHVQNVESVAKGAAGRGWRTLVCCWSSSELARGETADAQLTAVGVPSVALETLLDVGDVLDAIVLGFRTRRVLRLCRRSAPPALATSIARGLHGFSLFDVPMRILYAKALERALAHRRVRAFKPWGAPEGFEFACGRRVASRGGPALIFQYWLGAALPWPYSDPAAAMDVFFAKSEAEAVCTARDYHLPPDRVVVAGPLRDGLGAEPMSLESRRAAQAAARRSLGIVPSAFVVAWDPNAALLGYQSQVDQYAALDALAGFVSTQANAWLLVKPHPSYDVSSLLKTVSCTRMIILDRFSSVETFLDAADVFVTKYSTLLLEAALRAVPAIALLLDAEARFLLFGELVPAVRSVEALQRLLSEIASSSQELDAFVREATVRRRREIRRYLAHGGESVQVVLNELGRRAGLRG